MARKTSTELFELIKSMTSSEKRYFKIFSSLHTVGDQNRYMKLFDLIDEQDTYDEAALVKGVNDKGGATFSKLKRYLYDLLLKSMRNFNAERNGIYQLNATIDNMAILFGKGLYEHSAKMLNKAVKISEQYELISYGFVLDNWGRRINFQLGEEADTGNGISKSYEDIKKLDRYQRAFRKVQEFARNYSCLIREEALPEAGSEILNQSIPSDSRRIAFFAHRIKAISYRLTRNYSEYLSHAEGAWSIVQNNESLQNEDHLTFAVEPILEYANALLNNAQYGDFSRIIKKANPYIQSPKLNLGNETQANIRAYVNLMNSEYDRKNGRMKNMEEHLKQIEAIKAEPALHPSKALINLYYWEEINWYFLANEFEKTISAIDEMRLKIPDYQTIQAANGLRWICLYELGRTTDLQREAEEQEVPSKLELSLLTHFTGSNPRSMRNLMHLKKELAVLKEASEENLHFKFFDFTGWINAYLLHHDLSEKGRRKLHYQSH